MIIRAKRLNFEQIPLRKKGNRDRGIPIVQILDRDINLSLPKPNSSRKYAYIVNRASFKPVIKLGSRDQQASLKDQTIQLQATTIRNIGNEIDRANRMIGDLYETWYLGETIDSRRRN